MYSGDAQERAKATELFREHAGQRAGAREHASGVQQFYAAGVRKLGIPRPELYQSTQALLNLPLITVTAPFIVAALERIIYAISFWDALIIAAAESGNAEILYTEDLNDRQQYGRVVARNPFRVRTS